MKSILPDRSLVRQYLLGRLDDKDELEDDLSQRILFSDDLSEMADSIEDEIIEEYLDGTLDSADKKAVDEYFLRPPERKEKLRFARLLQHHFTTKPGDLNQTSLDIPGPRQNVARAEGGVGTNAAWRSRFVLYGQFAALILLGISSLIYTSGVRKGKARLEGELAQERERSANLAKDAQLLQSPMVPLTLVSDRARGTGGKIPHVEIKSSPQRIVVDIALQGAASSLYDVSLETGGGKESIWSARVQTLMSASGDAQLVFDVPVQGIESGVYSFAVLSAVPRPGSSEGPKYYDFQIKVKK